MTIKEAKKMLDTANEELSKLFGKGAGAELSAGLEKCNDAFRAYCKANCWR